MPWWHPGWTKHLSPRTVKTLKSNWLLRSCTMVCQTRQQTCWMNRTVWLTTSPTTVCTVKEPSRSWLPTTHPSHLLSRTSPRSFLPPPRVWTPLVRACNTAASSVLRPKTFASVLGAEEEETGRKEQRARETKDPNVIWEWWATLENDENSSCKVELCLFFICTFDPCWVFPPQTHMEKFKSSSIIFSREIMFLKCILQSFKLFLSLMNLKWALSWFCELAPMSLGLFSPLCGPFCCPVEKVSNWYLYVICVLRMSKLQGTSGFSHLEDQEMRIITFFQLIFREGVVTLVFNDVSNFRRLLC